MAETRQSTRKLEGSQNPKQANVIAKGELSFGYDTAETIGRSGYATTQIGFLGYSDTGDISGTPPEFLTLDMYRTSSGIGSHEEQLDSGSPPTTSALIADKPKLPFSKWDNDGNLVVSYQCGYAYQTVSVAKAQDQFFYIYVKGYSKTATASGEETFKYVLYSSEFTGQAF